MVKTALARRALATLEELLGEPRTPIVRDALIQRFEYTSEAVWKSLQVHLREDLGLVVNSPKTAFREAAANGWITPDLALALMAAIDDRNLTSHTYVESLAIAIADRIPAHAASFATLLAALPAK